MESDRDCTARDLSSHDPCDLGYRGLWDRWVEAVESLMDLAPVKHVLHLAQLTRLLSVEKALCMLYGVHAVAFQTLEGPTPADQGVTASATCHPASSLGLHRAGPVNAGWFWSPADVATYCAIALHDV